MVLEGADTGVTLSSSPPYTWPQFLTEHFC